MTKSKDYRDAFETSLKKPVISGSLKFTTQYCSQYDVYVAALNWVKSTNAVIYAAVGSGGEDLISIDFRYDESISAQKPPKSFMYDLAKPFFEKELGGDYMKAWSVDRMATVIK